MPSKFCPYDIGVRKALENDPPLELLDRMHFHYFWDVWVTFQASTFHVSSDYHSENCVWSQKCKM